jgi:ribonuclease BN (tRNA processing enzyme)
MASAATFTITYWGVTGSFPAPLTPRDVSAKVCAAVGFLAQRGLLDGVAAASHDFRLLARYLDEHLPVHLRSTWGGNTTCLEVQTPDALLILDCGSGFRELGTDLARRWRAADYQGPRQGHVLITHPHMDHTFATPFFDPYHDPRNHFTLYGSASVLKSLDAVLSPASPLSNTYFPPTLDMLKALRERRTIEAGMTFAIGSTTVSTIALRHPGGCLGYRLDCGGRSFVFCTDHEHADVPDLRLAEFARGADLLYLDGQYFQAEYEGRAAIMDDPPLARRGWGHSTVEACAATAAAADVRALHLGHREPRRDDLDISRVEACLRIEMAAALRNAGREPGACVACVPFEGMTVQL